MNLVIDANILFAILIKEGKTEELLYEHKLYGPEFLFTEFDKYRTLILEKTKRKEEDFDKLLEILKRRIELVPNKETNGFMEEAQKICADKKDIDYFCLALMKDCSIWSNDKKMREQTKVIIYSTQELARILDG